MVVNLVTTQKFWPSENSNDDDDDDNDGDEDNDDDNNDIIAAGQIPLLILLTDTLSINY